MDTITQWAMTFIFALSEVIHTFPGTTVAVLVVLMLWVLSRDI